MKRILIALATVICCVLLASCTKEQQQNKAVTYSMGFETPIHTTDPSKIDSECQQVNSIFVSAIQTELGVNVTNSQFTYGGGDTKVKAACDKAAQSLSQIPLVCHFKYVVAKETTVIYTWQN